MSNPSRELRNLHANGSASLAELREFLAELKGRKPQEVIGIVSASLLACAARGEGVPEFHSAMSGVARQNDDILGQSLDLMFERCGESGMAFILGSMLAFEAFDPEA